MKKYKAILFDVDGVLINSEPIVTEASKRVIVEAGAPAVLADFKPFTGMGADKFIGGVAEKYGILYTMQMKDRMHEIFLDLLTHQDNSFEGTLEMMDSLQEKGYILALASSADKVKLSANINSVGLDLDKFVSVTSGSDVNRKKPFPDIYILAAKRTEVNPEDCLVVEDSLSGVKAAKSAGMDCVGVTTSFNADAMKDAGANYVVEIVADILSVVG